LVARMKMRNIYRAFHNVLRGLQTFITRKRLSRTLHTVVFDKDSSLAAVPVDFFELRRKLARTRSTSSSAVNGRPLDFC
jgi:hypothetical protein